MEHELRKSADELRKNAEELARRDGRLIELSSHVQRLEEMRSRLENELRKATADIDTSRERFAQVNQLLHTRSIELVEKEKSIIELTASLRKQLHATRRLSHLLDDAGLADSRLRTSRRWKFANPLAALSALFFGRPFGGYGHLEKVVKAYSEWRKAHPDVERIDQTLHELKTGGPRSPIAAAPRLTPEQPQPPAEPVEFATHKTVETSIVIPVFNQFAFTCACLASLQRHAGSERFEVIVVDDGSTDATEAVIAKIPGVVYLRNDSNIGFIGSCNRGAAQARGNYLVFLNNDTEVTNGWLAALRETFEFEPRAGLVGAKLVFPDGRLQEAGGIIWRDAPAGIEGSLMTRKSQSTTFCRG